MTALVAIDLFAAILVLAGIHVAFRQKAWRGRPGAIPRGEPDQLASVFRIVGVMILAFGVTICVFANLIAYYSADK